MSSSAILLFEGLDTPFCPQVSFCRNHENICFCSGFFFWFGISEQSEYKVISWGGSETAVLTINLKKPEQTQNKSSCWLQASSDVQRPLFLWYFYGFNRGSDSKTKICKHSAFLVFFLIFFLCLISLYVCMSTSKDSAGALEAGEGMPGNHGRAPTFLPPRFSNSGKPWWGGPYLPPQDCIRVKVQRARKLSVPGTLGLKESC